MLFIHVKNIAGKMLYLSETYVKEDHPPLPRTASDSSLDEDDIDMLVDAESDKDIFRFVQEWK